VSTTVTLKVTREGRYWVGVPDGCPGSCMGHSMMELIQEAQAILPFMASGSDGTPIPDVVIDYVFTDVPIGLSDDSAAILGISRQRANQLRNA
jgi:hypothetical protein